MNTQAHQITNQPAAVEPAECPEAVSVDAIGWIERELGDKLRGLRQRAASRAQEARDAGETEYASWLARH